MSRLPKIGTAGRGSRHQMYEWIKALHVIAVIAWMAGMLYLPRLFVYHCDTARSSPRRSRSWNAGC